MYRNFLTAMKDEGVTFAQIGSLLGCRYQTVSDTVNGETKKGFYHEDAVMIRNKHMFDESNYTTITCVCQWEKKGGCGKW